LSRRPRLALIAFCLAAWLPGLFVLPPSDRDESRFAQATKQMIETGDYVRIMNGSEPRNRKPIGIYWLQAPFAIAARAAGLAQANPIWPYRLPSALGGLAAVLATFELGLVLGADRRRALLAGLMLAGCVILTVETHIAKTDAALTGAVTLTMAMLARAWTGARLRPLHIALFWLAAAACILLKGPIGPMVIALASVTLATSSGRWRWLLALQPGWGLPLMLAAVLPWFAAIGIATQGAFFTDAIGGDLGHKLAGGAEAHGGFPGLHALLLPLLTFPSTAFVLAAVPAAWSRRREPATRFLLAWIVPSWIVFELVPTRLPHYTLPLYPALFLLAALNLDLRPGAAGPGAPLRALGACAALLLGLAALVLPPVLHGAWWLGLPAAFAAIVAGWFAWRGRLLRALAASVLLYACILQVELPSLRPLWIAPRVEAALRRDWPRSNKAGWNVEGHRLAVAGYAEPSLMFLAGTSLSLLPDGRSAAAALATGAADLVLVEAADLPAFEAELARRHRLATELDAISGFNYSRGRWATLSLFVIPRLPVPAPPPPPRR
jgi:4-amino-4-deoxy-L-arabinose transferase-like glycosyltransferase